jgi:hypothetical protein
MKLRFDVRTIGLAALLLGTTMGHGDGCCHSEEVLGPPTGATCPPTSTLTYQSFGQQFMTDYCVKCHDSQKTGDDRNGATIDHDFDTVIGVRSVSNHIDQAAGAGPDAVNRPDAAGRRDAALARGAADARRVDRLRGALTRATARPPTW